MAIQKPGAVEIRFYQPGAMRNAGHAAARFVEILGLHALEQKIYRARIFRDFDTERLGHRIGCDVVMRRADAAGREKIIVALAKRIDRRDNLGRDVGDDPRFPQIDAKLGEITGEIGDVLVLRAAGQDLVADDESRRRHGHGLRHDFSPGPQRVIFKKRTCPKRTRGATFVAGRMPPWMGKASFKQAPDGLLQLPTRRIIHGPF